MCKDTDCLERHEQGGEKCIEKGSLRIGRRVMMKGRGGSDEDVVSIMWFHARCIFNTFLRSRKTTRVIESPEDLEGFGLLDPQDQDMLRKFINCNDEVRGWRGRGLGVGGAASMAAGSFTKAKPGTTPEKRGAAALLDPPTAYKKVKTRPNDVTLVKGRQVWTYCKVRPPPPTGPGPALEFAIRSPKPELGQIVEEEKDGSFIIQFEKTEHEQERMEKFSTPKFKKIRGWLRYPRVFEGKKQRIPMNWIQHSRAPPRLCSCTKQDWGHSCDCGISCSRGSTKKVWGVGS